MAEVDDVSSSEGGVEDKGEKIVGLVIFSFVVGMFTFIGLFQKGDVSWFLYVFLMPFWLAFPWAILGKFIPFIVYVILFPILKVFLQKNPATKPYIEK